jgi:hypothetical protein
MLAPIARGAASIRGHCHGDIECVVYARSHRLQMRAYLLAGRQRSAPTPPTLRVKTRCATSTPQRIPSGGEFLKVSVQGRAVRTH